ncbi:MAG: hypothetical protein V3T64_11885 [Myxococcota bacterium]
MTGLFEIDEEDFALTLEAPDLFEVTKHSTVKVPEHRSRGRLLHRAIVIRASPEPRLLQMTAGAARRPDEVGRL